MLNAFTVDFEDWYQGLEIGPSDWAGYARRLEPATRRLLDVLGEAGVKATFFVLGIAAEEHPELVRLIARQGHELATHGHSHALVYQLSPQTYRTELERSIRVIEDLAGTKVLGHRAAFFSITRQSTWALDLLVELGVRYDSSIYPVLNYRYGIDDAPRWPHPLTAGGRSIVEFPISTWRLAGRNVPIAGGAYFRLYPYAFTRMGFRSINRQGQPAVFYIHPWELDPGQPRIRLPRRIALTHYANLGATEGRLRRLLRDFRFAPMKDVLGVG
jgi:polysaccharide deacetylase family protein (PEP-CTERM system associated)